MVIIVPALTMSQLFGRDILVRCLTISVALVKNFCFVLKVWENHEKREGIFKNENVLVSQVLGKQSIKGHYQCGAHFFLQ